MEFWILLIQSFKMIPRDDSFTIISSEAWGQVH